MLYSYSVFKRKRLGLVRVGAIRPTGFPLRYTSYYIRPYRNRIAW